MAAEMLELARGMPGFIDFKSFRAEDGEQLSVAWSARNFLQYTVHDPLPCFCHGQH
jgi:heme-degrading monooxygenase HmoA